MTTATADRWPSVLAVVVNSNGRDDLERCLAVCPRATWLANPTNVGYTRAVNQGIARGLENHARYVWVLNNDVVLPPDMLRRLVDVGHSVHAQPKEG